MKLLFALIISIISTCSFAGVSGIGGGSALNNSRVTVQVCNQGESSNECRTITYNVRTASPATLTTPTCYYGEIEGPCPKTFGAPGWLKTFNDAFPKPENNNLVKPDYSAGPN